MGYTDQGIGHAHTDTSRKAAEHSAPKLTIRQQVRELFVQVNHLTCEDVARMLQRPEISVKPRVTELKNDGFLRDSGKRREGKWGTSIIVWERNEA